ncbi:MAG: hypothetical protein ABL962_21485 [Fimbriimonadaceae bacterium]
MLILKLILQFVAVGFAVLTATLDYVVRDKRTLKFKRLRICLYCIAGALLIVSLAVTVSDDVVRKEEIAALRQELDRNLHTIEHVGFEFLILLPMDHPALVPYVSRISPLVTSRQLTQGPERQVQITVPFGNKSPLHPDLVTERTAYTFLSIMCLGVELFKDPAKAEEFAPVAGHSQGKGDLAYLLSRSASEKNHGHRCRQTHVLSLRIECKGGFPAKEHREDCFYFRPRRSNCSCVFLPKSLSRRGGETRVFGCRS